MLFRFLLFSALLAAPALGSAIKGYQQRAEASEAPTKGGRPLLSPIEQIKIQQKPERLEQQRDEQLPLQQEKYTATEQQKLEELPRTEELQQQKLEEAPREEVKGYRYEARPQVNREELAKGQTRYEQAREEPLAKGQRQEELPKAATKTEQREEPLAKGQVKYEQREEPLAKGQTRYEQVREETAKGQATKYEQRREELPAKTEVKIEQREEPLAKGQVRYEQREESLPKGQLKPEHHGEDWSSKGAAKTEQIRYEQREELPAAKGAPKLEQREQQQEEFRQEQYEQQVELQQEQRRYEEPAASPLLVQPIQPLTVVEETRSEQFQQQQIEQHAVKGGELSAPAGMAEPYAFSYQVDGSSRTESGDNNGVVRGQYTLQGADGLSRVVEYVADHNGFRAAVSTNEPGTQAGSPANIQLRTSQANAEDITLRLEGKTREDLAAPTPLQAAKGAPAPALAQTSKASEWSIKAPAPALPLPPQPQQQLEEAPLAPSKGLLPAPLPAKRLEEPLKGKELQHPQQEPAREAKSAELARTPKALGELKANQPAQLRAGFESATAHRTYVRPVSTVVHRQYQQPPAIPVRLHHQAPPSVLRAPAPAVSRAYLQRERYPPSPVNQPGYRRSHHQPSGNTRVSFYSAPPAAPIAPAPIPIGYDDFESTVDSS